MELKEFVKETLIQITESIKESQNECKKHGGLVNPMLETPISTSEIFEIESKYYPVSTVDFKIGLVESNTTSGKGGIGVFLPKISLRAEASKEKENQSITNVEFRVNVVFPYISRDGKHIPLSSLNLY